MRIVEGLIFDIQRFSVHDGPGIRTTVFMKGCPLRCLWCHNPEGILAKRELQYFELQCIHCNRCGARLRLEDAEKCPTKALGICGQAIEQADLLEILLKDKMFYAQTGGVTFSGGECLTQANFIAPLLGQLKENHIQTAIDTSGYVDFLEFEKVLRNCDLFLYDIKMMDDEKHKIFTGVSNQLILQNVQKLSQQGKPIWVRVPIIPGVNDTIEEVAAIADFVATLSNVDKATLMPYHVLGKSKYQTLGLECGYTAPYQITQTQMDDFSRIFIEREINIGE